VSGSARGEDGIAAGSRRRGQLGVARAASRHGKAFLAVVERVRGEVGDASGLDVALGSKARSGPWTPHAARCGCRDVVARVWSRRLLVTVARTRSSCSSSRSSGRGSTRRCGAGLLLDAEGSTPRRGGFEVLGRRGRGRRRGGGAATRVLGVEALAGGRRRCRVEVVCRGTGGGAQGRARRRCLGAEEKEEGGGIMGKKRRAAARVLIRVVA